MVCVDMDGTLLNKKKRISHKDKIALKKAHDEKGVHIVITTGRLYRDASYYSNLLGVKSSIISGNGAFIKDEEKNQIVSKKNLRKDEFEIILDACEKFKVFANLYTIDSIYIRSKIYALIETLLMIRRHKNFKVNILNVKNKNSWNDILEKNKDNIIKGLVLSFNRKKLKILKEYLRKEFNFEATMSSKFTLEINSNKVNKANAVKELGRYYKVKREDIICIGDNENDLSMIEYAGLGVAMGNAKDIVKEKADFVTFDNNNFGVANVVYKYIFSK